jgi:MtaA/CmuA family methyltransferase
MQTEYTSTDRLKDALSGIPKDRVPICPLMGINHMADLLKVSMNAIKNDPGKYVDAMIKGRELLEIDFLSCEVNGTDVPMAYGCEIRVPEKGMPLAEPLTQKLDTLQNIDELRSPDPVKDGKFPYVNAVIRGLGEYAKGRIPIIAGFEGPLSTCCRLMDSDTIMRMFIKNREVLEALLDRVNQFLIFLGQEFVKNGASLLFIPEPTASSSMISPKSFKDLILPRLRKFFSEIDVPCVLHICGDTSPILRMMAETGADVLSLDQCMNLQEAREKVPESVIGGNVDPIESLMMGDAEKVAQNTLNCLMSAGTNKYILMSGCGIPPEAPLENIQAMIKTAHEYGLGNVN